MKESVAICFPKCKKKRCDLKNTVTKLKRRQAREEVHHREVQCATQQHRQMKMIQSVM